MADKQRFAALLDQMEPLLGHLLACPAHKRGVPPAAPKQSGVYLFSEKGKPMYVGRTRNFQRRWGEHTAPSSPENSAPFAFNIALRSARRGHFDTSGSRKAIASRSGFDDYFAAAKRRVRAMDFRFVEIEDPSVSTVFEVYASLALDTEGEFSLFETH